MGFESFGTLASIGLILLFMSSYQADPDNYFEFINDTIGTVFVDIEEDLQDSFSDKPTLNTFVNLLIKSMILGLIASLYLLAFVAELIPFSAIELLNLWAILFVLALVPWNFLLGVSFLVKDWWKKRKSSDSIETDKVVK